MTWSFLIVTDAYGNWNVRSEEYVSRGRCQLSESRASLWRRDFLNMVGSFAAGAAVCRTRLSPVRIGTEMMFVAGPVR